MLHKILIVGYGSIGRRHLKNIRALMPEASIAVLSHHYDKNLPIPLEANFLFNSEEAALNFFPSLVIISNAAPFHISTAIAFLKQKANLFIEKPIAVSVSDALKLQKESQSNPAFIMVGYVLRFFPILNAIKKFIVNGKLGTIYSAQIQVGQYLPDWRPNSDYRDGVSAKKELGGGVLLELSHEIDYSIWLFGFPTSLFCSMAQLSNLEINVEDHANLIFEYTDDKKRISMQLDFLQRIPNMELRITGSNGTLKADLISESITFFDLENLKGTDLTFPPTQDGNEMYLRQFDFLCAKSFPGYLPKFENALEFSDYSDLEHSIKVLKLIESARESNEFGKRVAVEKRFL